MHTKWRFITWPVVSSLERRCFSKADNQARFLSWRKARQDSFNLSSFIIQRSETRILARRLLNERKELRNIPVFRDTGLFIWDSFTMIGEWSSGKVWNQFHLCDIAFWNFFLFIILSNFLQILSYPPNWYSVKIRWNISIYPRFKPRFLI